MAGLEIERNIIFEDGEDDGLDVLLKGLAGVGAGCFQPRDVRSTGLGRPGLPESDHGTGMTPGV